MNINLINALSNTKCLYIRNQWIHTNVNIFKLLKHNFHSSNCIYHDLGPSDRIFSGINHPKHPSNKKFSKPTITNIKKGFAELKSEIKKWQEEMKIKMEADILLVRPGDTDLAFEFKSQADLDKWVVTSDKDNKMGNSSANMSLSPSGALLFTGRIDTTLPDDGITKKTGYANIQTKQLMKSFKRETCYDWSLYTHLVLRVRGDGRRYLINIDTSGMFDLTWYDIYSYILYTRGGPYWQDVKIPFSKFIFGAAGRFQDKQTQIPLKRVQRIGFTAADGVCDNFRLEIDHIALHNDPSHRETFAYELYNVPKHVVF